MLLPSLTADYGYLAVFAGSLLEGETILVLAGYAAHRGHLSLPVVIALAFVGGTLGDQIFFWIGRHWGNALLRRFPRQEGKVRRVRALLLRHHAALIVGVRFMYGLRILGPIAIGMSEVGARRFLVFNLIGALIWSVAVAGAGFLFGHALETMLPQAERYEGLALGLLVLLAVVIGLAHQLLARRRRRASRTAANAHRTDGPPPPP
jgi:membrane protein DedA with SNARE-associated domain